MTSLHVTYGLQMPLALAAVLGALLAAAAAPHPAAAQSDEAGHEVGIAVEEIDNIEIGGDDNVEINIEDPEYFAEGGDEWKEADEEVDLTIETNSSSKKVDIDASVEASDPDVEDFGLEVKFENFEEVQAERSITRINEGSNEGLFEEDKKEEFIKPSTFPAALEGKLTYKGKVSVDFLADESATVTVEHIMTDN